MNIYLDIETIPAGEPLTELEVTVDKRLKDPEKIAEARQNKIDEEYRKRALDSTKGQILCISFAIDDAIPVTIINNTESTVIKLFDDALKTIGDKYIYNTKFIGHNIYGFDAVWLIRKGWKYGCWFAENGRFPISSKSERLIDTMKHFGVTDWKSYIKQDEVAKFFGIKGKTIMDGSQVYDYYCKDKLDDIAKYCEEDVITLREIAKKMHAV